MEWSLTPGDGAGTMYTARVGSRLLLLLYYCSRLDKILVVYAVC